MLVAERSVRAEAVDVVDVGCGLAAHAAPRLDPQMLGACALPLGVIATLPGSRPTSVGLLATCSSAVGAAAVATLGDLLAADAHSLGHRGGGWIRTTDLRDMSPARYRLRHPDKA